MSWIRAELDYEYWVAKQTRLGCLCDDRTPTLEQEHIAHVEAQKHVKRLTNVSRGLQQLIDLGESL